VIVILLRPLLYTGAVFLASFLSNVAVAQIAPGVDPDRVVFRGPEGVAVTAEDIREYFILQSGEFTTESLERKASVEIAIENIYVKNLISNRASAAGLVPDMLIKATQRNARTSLLVKAWLDEKVRLHLSAVDWELVAREAFYANPQKYTSEETRQVRHILLESNTGESFYERAERAERIRSEILAGKDFNDAAREYSDDSSAERGGALGAVTRARLVPDFAKVAFSLEQGALSDVFMSPYGLHIVQVTEILPASQRTFEEVKDGIIQTEMKQSAASYREFLINDLKLLTGDPEVILDQDALRLLREEIGAR